MKFTTVNTFPNQTSNGQISMTIPADLNITASLCSATIGSQTVTCTKIGQSVIIQHALSTSVALQQVVVSFSSFVNPSSNKPTASFIIYSQDQVGGTPYNIDGVSTGFTYLASVLGDITNASLSRLIGSTGLGYRVGR